MRTRRSRVIATATAVLALGILVPVIASGSSAERKVASNSPAATKKAGAGSFQRIQRMAPIDRACSLSCTQRALLKLIKKHNKLVDQFNTLANSVYNCERVQPVTRYTGYDYFGTPGAATALDFTNPGSAVSANMLVYSC